MTGRRYFVRGAVVKFSFPDPADPSRPGAIPKYGVILQGGDYWRFHVRLLIALCTSQSQTAPWPHMVFVPTGTWRFSTDTWIDCADLYRFDRTLLEEGEEIGVLPDALLKAIDEALVIGTGIIDGNELIETEAPERG